MGYNIYLYKIEDDKFIEISSMNWHRNPLGLRRWIEWQFGLDIVEMLPKESYNYYSRFDRQKLLDVSVEVKRLFSYRKDNQSELFGDFDINFYEDWINKWYDFCMTAQDNNLYLYVSD